LARRQQTYVAVAIYFALWAADRPVPIGSPHLHHLSVQSGRAHAGSPGLPLPAQAPFALLDSLSTTHVDGFFFGRDGRQIRGVRQARSAQPDLVELPGLRLEVSIHGHP
jgi:hypothetical protein